MAVETRLNQQTYPTYSIFLSNFIIYKSEVFLTL